MYNTAIIVLQFAAILESIVVITGNIFTIFVFWKHRNRLKRTSFLLINLAVADLFVGLTATLGPTDLEKPINSARKKNISTAFNVTFSFSSAFFLALISLERAYALIWPLRHRVSGTKGYIYSATFTWIAAVPAGTLALLAVYDILDFFHWIVAFGSVLGLCLVTISVSYLAIRTRLNCTVPAIYGAHNRQNEQQKNAKLAKTMFLVITASLLFWIPSIVVYTTHYICFRCVLLLVVHIFNLLRLANSVVDLIIYSFRVPMFKETFKRVKFCKQSKKYIVNYTP